MTSAVMKDRKWPDNMHFIDNFRAINAINSTMIFYALFKNILIGKTFQIIHQVSLGFYIFTRTMELVKNWMLQKWMQKDFIFITRGSKSLCKVTHLM